MKNFIGKTTFLSREKITVLSLDTVVPVQDFMNYVEMKRTECVCDCLFVVPLKTGAVPISSGSSPSNAQPV